MFRFLILIFITVLILPIATAMAQQSSGNGSVTLFDEPRNSLFYLKQDGDFSDEDKDEEALYIYQSCNNNAIQSRLFDCMCIAGSFRIERDNEDLIPQSHILSSLYNQENSQCVNIPGLAGNTYGTCMNESKYYNESSTDEENSKYCSCLANKTTTDFSKNPKLNLRHYNKIKSGAARSATPFTDVKPKI